MFETGARFSVFSNAEASPVEMISVGQKFDRQFAEIGARFSVFSNAGASPV